jgi:hypothetical protein
MVTKEWPHLLLKMPNLGHYPELGRFGPGSLKKITKWLQK